MTVTAPSSTGTARVQIIGRVATVGVSGTVLVDLTAFNSGIGTNEIQTAAVTNTKLAGLARGYIKRGSAAGVVEDYDANDTGKILVGDGTDLNSVAVTGDVTLTAAGAITVNAGALKSTVDNARYTQINFKTGAVCTKSTGAVCAGGNGDTENLMFSGERSHLLEEHFKAASTTLMPQLAAGGLEISLQQLDNVGSEFTQGLTSRSRAYYTVGTDAFYFKATATLTDVSGSDPFCVGLRTPKAYQAVASVADVYNNYSAASDEVVAVCVGVAGGGSPIALHTYTKVGAAAVTNTTLAATWADTATHTIELDVSAAGAVTYKIDGAADGNAVAFSGTGAVKYIPFIIQVHSTDLADSVLLSLWETGLQ
jgi:hypothetical protein